MFLVNSRCHHFSATLFRSRCKIRHVLRAYLLPKLRYHFAEFLNQGSLKRLRILTPPTCVGLRYDHLIISLEAFLDSMGSITYGHTSSASHLEVNKETDLPISSLYLLAPPSIRRLTYPSVSLHHSNDHTVVQEY